MLTNGVMSTGAVPASCCGSGESTEGGPACDNSNVQGRPRQGVHASGRVLVSAALEHKHSLSPSPWRRHVVQPRSAPERGIPPLQRHQGRAIPAPRTGTVGGRVGQHDHPPGCVAGRAARVSRRGRFPGHVQGECGHRIMCITFAYPHGRPSCSCTYPS